MKAAVDDDTERWLRNENKALSLAEPFQPRIVDFIEGPNDRPVLLTEDLSHAYWPASHAGVTWRESDIGRVLATVREMSEVAAPDDLTALGMEAFGPWWPALLEDPTELRALGVCDGEWLARYGSQLAEAETRLDRRGDRLVHGDVRSDNICLLEDRVVFVDWSSSGRGHAESDLAELLPTLSLEGGPSPFDVMPEGAAWAAAQAGYLATRAISGKLYEGKDQPAPAWLIRVLTKLTRIDLVWAAECLGLSPPGGAM